MPTPLACCGTSSRWDVLVDRVLNDHDLDAIDELVAEDVHEQDPPPGTGEGRQGRRDPLASRFEAWTLDAMPDGRLVDSRVLMDARGRLTQLGALPGPDAAPTG